MSLLNGSVGGTGCPGPNGRHHAAGGFGGGGGACRGGGGGGGGYKGIFLLVVNLSVTN